MTATLPLSKNFYPRPPRGGRLQDHGVHVKKTAISIHALREEGDSLIFLPAWAGTYFYPRPPRGGRRVLPDLFSVSLVISIHALREEGDRAKRGRVKCRQKFLSTPSARRATRGGAGLERSAHYFYPRPPRGGRHQRHHPHRPGKKNFYPRPPRGGRRQELQQITLTLWISIHALREEGDCPVR